MEITPTNPLTEEGQLSYEETILSGLVPPGKLLSLEDEREYRDRLLTLIDRINLESLKQENRALIQSMQAFQEDTGGRGVLTEEVLLDMLVREQVPVETQVKYQELFHRYSQNTVSSGKFVYAISRFLREKQEERFTKALAEAYDIKSKGLVKGKQIVKGYAAARQFLESELFELDRDEGTRVIPEGEIRSETDDVIIEYNDRKTEPEKYIGIKTGLSIVDDITNGAQPGELWVIGGFTEVGKTFCLINGSHYACTVQGKNVVVGAAEVVYSQFRRRVVLRHARNSKFGLPHGVDSDSFKKAKLTAQEEQAFAASMKDLKDNPDYGHYYLFQIPQGSDLDRKSVV